MGSREGQSHYIEEYDFTIDDSYVRLAATQHSLLFLQSKALMVDGASVILDVLDTAGSEEYSAMREQNIRNTEVSS